MQVTCHVGGFKKKTTTKQCQNLQLQLVECTLPMLLAKKEKQLNMYLRFSVSR